MSTYFNPEKYPGIKAFTRSLLFWIVFIGLLFGSGMLSPLFPAQFSRLLYGTFGTLAAFLATWIFLKYEKRSFKGIGLTWEKGTLFRFIKGLGLGSIIFVLILAFLLNFAGLHLRRTANDFNLFTFLGYFALLPLALMEEVGFRAYPFLNLGKTFGLRTTQFIVAVSFACYHVVNGWSIYQSLTGPFVWAFVFGLSAIWSGGIAVPTGIHVAVNLGQVLSGMSGMAGAVWKLDYDQNVSKAVMDKTGSFLLAVQLVILLGALIGTELYIRKKRDD